MDKEKAKIKLKKIKELAERGIGGERETALKMYRELLVQIFYMVTGDAQYYRYAGEYKRRKKRGVMCTEAEAIEIKFLFTFYKGEMKKELEAFMAAFRFKNNLFPDKSARCYEMTQRLLGDHASDLTDEEERMRKKALFMAQFMDGRKPPKALLGDNNETEVV